MELLISSYLSVSSNFDLLSCNGRDVITARDGLEATQPVLARYCSDVINDVTVTSSGSGLLIEFSSGGLGQGVGWAATYEFLTPPEEVSPVRSEGQEPAAADSGATYIRPQTKRPPSPPGQPLWATFNFNVILL